MIQQRKILKPEPLDYNQQAVIDMTFRSRPPENEYEKALLKEIEEAESKGLIIDLPTP